jgi:alkyldihydroxyacetonephosphate synthase
MSFDENLNKLRTAAPALEIATEGSDLTEKSHDYWIRSLMERRRDNGGPTASALVRPADAAEVAAVLAWADETGTPVVPYGLGSGVCGAVVAEAGQVVLDLGRMDRILDINDANLTVTVQPGMRGSDFEAELQSKGYTMGHWPQSIEMSTVGGWCATRASGQLSTLYGNIEEMLLGCEIAVPGGRLIRIPTVPRSATGPDLREVFLGNEGTLGVFTELVFRIHPKAECQIGRAFAFPELRGAIEALRLMLRQGWRPAVTRLYDAKEAGRNFAGVANEGMPVLLLMSEGTRARVEPEAAACAEIAKSCGGLDEGEEPITSWMEHRNHVPSWDDLLAQGLIADTIEVAIGWDRIGDLWEAVPKAVEGVEGVFAMTGHISHCYTQGANIYFTFVGAQQSMDQAIGQYDAVWNATLSTTHEMGGTIAHHHGIGRVRRPWLDRELGSAAEIGRTLKKVIDPNKVLNPGVLWG